MPEKLILLTVKLTKSFKIKTIIKQGKKKKLGE
jgi:hypothetical protein